MREFHIDAVLALSVGARGYRTRQVSRTAVARPYYIPKEFARQSRENSSLFLPLWRVDLRLFNAPEERSSLMDKNVPEPLMTR